MNHVRLLFVAVLGLLVLTLARPAAADGMIRTGDAIRVKSVGPFDVKVYSIRHDMKARPAERSTRAVIDAGVDKKFTWTMLRTVESAKIQKALREAFTMNGFSDKARIDPFVGAFSQEETKEKATVLISYDAAAKKTTIWVQGGGTATLAGEDFMKAVWSIWLGKIDQPKMSEQLIRFL